MKMSVSEFNKMSSLIYQECGIKMPPVKKTMLEGRLQKRLRELNLDNFKDYCDLILNKKNPGELLQMIDVVTTNKTDFFREPIHFDFLLSKALPELLKRSRNINIWSAGCSTGEEPYTIAICLQEYLSAGTNFKYDILGTDISTQVLQKAVTAIYNQDRIENLPLNIKKKYFLKSKDPLKRVVRVIPELRKNVTFQRLNFMEEIYEPSVTMDIIFCRNVLIYFDKETQEKVINKLCKNLKLGGYFFLGHSESITDMNLPLQQLVPTIFTKIK